MKKLILVLAAITCTSTFGYSGAAVDDARELLRHAKQRFAAGELTRTDVAAAEVYYFEMQFRSGYLSADEACPYARAAAKVFVDGIYAEYLLDKRTFLEVRDAKRELQRLDYECR